MLTLINDESTAVFALGLFLLGIAFCLSRLPAWFWTDSERLRFWSGIAVGFFRSAGIVWSLCGFVISMIYAVRPSDTDTWDDHGIDFYIFGLCGQAPFATAMIGVVYADRILTRINDNMRRPPCSR